MGFNEVRPGWFHGWAKNIKDFPKTLQSHASRLGINFTLFDPDAKKIPFHRSSEFMVIPEWWRFQFLVRNPPMQKRLTRQAGLVHYWNEQRRAGIAPVESHEVAIYLIGRHLYDVYGIGWEYVDLNGTAIDPPLLYLDPSYPDPPGPLFGGPTVRGRRQFKAGLDRRRKVLNLTPRRRQADEYYRKLLGIWDKREGFCGPALGYDPDRAVKLEQAASHVQMTPDAYYVAFRLIFGHEYEEALWQSYMAEPWIRRKKNGNLRRGRGRRRRPVELDPIQDPTARQPSDPALECLLALLNEGVELTIALDKAEVPEDLKQQIASLASDPSLRSLLFDFSP
jgi:hypothetical protein